MAFSDRIEMRSSFSTSFSTSTSTPLLLATYETPSHSSLQSPSRFHDKYYDNSPHAHAIYPCASNNNNNCGYGQDEKNRASPQSSDEEEEQVLNAQRISCEAWQKMLSEQYLKSTYPFAMEQDEPREDRESEKMNSFQNKRVSLIKSDCSHFSFNNVKILENDPLSKKKLKKRFQNLWNSFEASDENIRLFHHHDM